MHGALKLGLHQEFAQLVCCLCACMAVSRHDIGTRWHKAGVYQDRQQRGVTYIRCMKIAGRTPQRGASVFSYKMHCCCLMC